MTATTATRPSSTTATGARLRILVMSPGAVEGKLTGPEIRSLEFARALSALHEVVISTPSPSVSRLGALRVVGAGRAGIVREAARADVVISACMPPYLLALKRVLRFVAVADLYDPMEHELATIAHAGRRSREQQKRADILEMQLRSADLILCANAPQAQDLRAAAAAAQLAIPDPVVVPFGIPAPPPPSTSTPLHDRFPQLRADDHLILWWGSPWRWLDLETVIRAVAEISRTRDDVKLVVTAGRPPNPQLDQFDATDAARELARELGVLGSQVLLLEEWVPYDNRHEYISEASVGITLPRAHEEAGLAARSRCMDYLWAGLPCILASNEEVAAEWSAAGFATLIDSPQPTELARLLTGLFDDPGTLERAREGGQELRAGRQWQAVTVALLDAVAAAQRRTAGALETTLLVGASGRYYVREAADRFAGARP
jgi:glycosyltransferase involved in cell wall biosynthesis